MKASQTSTDLSGQAVTEISDTLRQLLADVFSLYMKTKNFHWHMTGRHFRDYHLLLDEHADQVFAMSICITSIEWTSRLRSKKRSAQWRSWSRQAK